MKHSALLSLVCILAMPALAHADTVFTSESSFLAATSSSTTVNFNGSATADSFSSEGSSFGLNGATFSVLPSGQYLNITGANYYPFTNPGLGIPTYNDGAYLVANGAGTTNELTITFAPSTAVGFSYGGIFGPGSFPVTLSDGTTLTLNTADSITGTGSLDFIGFTSTTPIDSITLDIPNTGNNGAIDNFIYGTASATPEPSGFVLLLTGLTAGVGAIRWRRAI